MKISAGIFLIAPTLIALGGCDREQPAPAQAVTALTPGEAGRLDRSHRGTAASDTAFEDPDGEPASFADFRGKPLLVNLWATWCAPCVAEMPTLDALAAREEGKLQVLALSQDLDGQAKVAAFFAERRFARLEPYIDPQLALMGELAVQSLPTTILYDAGGREVWRITGVEDWRSARAARLIAEAALDQQASAALK